MKKLILSLSLLSCISSQARDIVNDIPEFNCFNNNFRVATLVTTPATIQVTDTHFLHVGGENLKIDPDKTQEIAGFRVSGWELNKHCRTLRSENSFFNCAVDVFGVELLDDLGNSIAFLNTRASVYITSGFDEVEVRLVAFIDEKVKPTKKFELTSFRLWFNFDKPDRYSACTLKPKSQTN